MQSRFEDDFQRVLKLAFNKAAEDNALVDGNAMKKLDLFGMRVEEIKSTV